MATWQSGYVCRDFYPRSPCGERLWVLRKVPILGIFLSTLSLRRATPEAGKKSREPRNFYPRSPCGERPKYHRILLRHNAFLSTLSLRRATMGRHEKSFRGGISIHALLAESDDIRPPNLSSMSDFYPRSPCGERP